MGQVVNYPTDHLHRNISKAPQTKYKLKLNLLLLISILSLCSLIWNEWHHHLDRHYFIETRIILKDTTFSFLNTSLTSSLKPWIRPKTTSCLDCPSNLSLQWHQNLFFPIWILTKGQLLGWYLFIKQKSVFKLLSPIQKSFQLASLFNIQISQHFCTHDTLLYLLISLTWFPHVPLL